MGEVKRQTRRSMYPRSARLEVRLSQEGLDYVRSCAKESGMTVSRYVVEKITADQSGMTMSDWDDICYKIMRMERMLAAIGVNMNQVAKRAHLTGKVGENMTATINAINNQIDRVEALLDLIEAQPVFDL